jgi:hypothetical protein
MYLTRKRILALFLITLFFASSPILAEDLEAREQAARKATGELLKKLGGALKQEMSSGGPDKAIMVCRDLAPQIAGEISRANGWQVTRVGTRVRNPMLGMADDWESKVLADFEARAAKGEKYQDMAFGEVVEFGGAEHYRFMKAIPMQEACLSCHGSTEQIPDSVKARLASNYPLDRATGYKVGELRGAVSIVQPLAIPLVHPQTSAD